MIGQIDAGHAPLCVLLSQPGAAAGGGARRPPPPPAAAGAAAGRGTPGAHHHPQQQQQKVMLPRSGKSLDERLRRDTPFMCNIRFKNDMPEVGVKSEREGEGRVGH